MRWLILILVLTVASCEMERAVHEPDIALEDLVIVRVPPVLDENLSAGESQCRFIAFIEEREVKPGECIEVLASHYCRLLYVRLHENGSLTLNDERLGTITDPHALEARLWEIFDQREENEVRHDVSDRIVKDVAFGAPASTRWGDVYKLASTLDGLGANLFIIPEGAGAAVSEATP